MANFLKFSCVCHDNSWVGKMTRHCNSWHSQSILFKTGSNYDKVFPVPVGAKMIALKGREFSVLNEASWIGVSLKKLFFSNAFFNQDLIGNSVKNITKK